MNEMKINTTSLIFVLVTIALIVSMVYFLSLPMWNDIKTEKQTITNKNSELSIVSTKLESIKSLEDKFASLPLSSQSSQANPTDQYKDIADKLIPSDPELGDFLIQLDALVSQSGLSETNFSVTGLNQTPNPTSSSKSTLKPSNVSVVKNAQTHQFSISGLGTVGKIFNLIKNLQFANRLAELSLLSLKTTNVNNELDFQIGGNIFSNPQVLPNPAAKYSTSIIDNIHDDFSQIKSYGRLIDIDKETGFGRPNPFLPY